MVHPQSLPSKSLKQILYFLTGSTPVGFTIKRICSVYLHHILKQEENYLLRTFFEKQLNTRKSKNWASQILKDLTDFGITESIEGIRTIKEES